METYVEQHLEYPEPIVTIREGLFDELQAGNDLIHLVLIATKPDIIKQAPLIRELRRRQKSFLIVHSGQHYDWNLSGGLEEEFDIEPDINLNVRGALYEQQSQIIHRLGSILCQLKRMGKQVIPYTYGDTTTAVAGGVASFMNLSGVGHVEAGLRTMTPPRVIFDELLAGLDVRDYYQRLQESGDWAKGSYEPFPEQFNTRAAAPSAGIHFAPTRLNAKHLLDEGFSGKRIFVVGNPVSDALDFAATRLTESTIFQKYPLLQKGQVIRFCVHRRENVTSLHRFKVIFDAMIELVREGRTVLLISLEATEKALNAYGLKGRVEDLSCKYDNFVYSPVWPRYTDVVAAMRKCAVIATDSGSIQEEANILGVPGVILRFNSDRPEAIFAGSNILAPPLRAETVAKIIRTVMDDQELDAKMRRVGNLYGEKICERIIGVVDRVHRSGSLFDLLEHKRLGFDKLDFWEAGGTEW